MPTILAPFLRLEMKCGPVDVLLGDGYGHTLGPYTVTADGPFEALALAQQQAANDDDVRVDAHEMDPASFRIERNGEVLYSTGELH